MSRVGLLLQPYPKNGGGRVLPTMAKPQPRPFSRGTQVTPRQDSSLGSQGLGKQVTRPLCCQSHCNLPRVNHSLQIVTIISPFHLDGRDSAMMHFNRFPVESVQGDQHLQRAINPPLKPKQPLNMPTTAQSHAALAEKKELGTGWQNHLKGVNAINMQLKWLAVTKHERRSCVVIGLGCNLQYYTHPVLLIETLPMHI